MSTPPQPRMRITATYPPTQDGRLPESVQIDINSVDGEPDTGDDSDDRVDGTAGYRRLIGEIIAALGGIASREAAPKFVFAPVGRIEQVLRDLSQSNAGAGAEGAARQWPAAVPPPGGKPSAGWHSPAGGVGANETTDTVGEKGGQ